ncbi:MAG: guanylate kinase [Actinobacteria bacterium]|nr:guanylate kinase [Actinomycetota bacterium]
MKKGKIFVVAGPSGAGKDTLIRKAVKGVDRLHCSISATTRKPRKGETDGKDYFFLDKNEFERKADGGEFLEHKQVFGNKYGTLWGEVSGHIESGENVLLEIDVQGALDVKSKVEDAMLIFIMPPSLEELESRLLNRKTDVTSEIKTRMEIAPAEMEIGKKYFDIIVYNEDVDEAAEKLAGILKGE